MKEKGNASVIEAVCNICKPFLLPIIRERAKPACNKAQIIFFLFEGFKSPSEDKIPRTKVAEFAEVTKNVKSKTIVKTLTKAPNGKCSITTKYAVGVETIASFITDKGELIAIRPKIENQTNDTKAGANKTPVINSLIVRPFEILAMKSPVNGAQAMNQAQ